MNLKLLEGLKDMGFESVYVEEKPTGMKNIVTRSTNLIKGIYQFNGQFLDEEVKLKVGTHKLDDLIASIDNLKPFLRNTLPENENGYTIKTRYIDSLMELKE